MSVEAVRDYFAKWGKSCDVMEFETSSATVADAARTIGCEEARIAKTLSFRVGEDCVLVLTAGDAKVDNRKFKDFFGCKAKMLGFEEVSEVTGHPVGGVCPFAVPADIRVYLDVSMKRFETVFPACGSPSSAIELECDRLDEYTGALGWTDVCKGWQDEGDI